MSTPPEPESAFRPDSISARFASMILQQTNMALMLLGRIPHPESGQSHTDVEAARMFIDQLEMLEHKTRGNLEPQEEKLLQQSLTTLRMAFVEAISEEPESRESVKTKAEPAAADTPTGSSPAPDPAKQPDEESRRKFVKKY